MNTEDRKDYISSKIKAAESILIVSHYNPDGDAVGSCLGLYHYLKSLDKKVQVILPNHAGEYIQWLKAYDSILIDELNPEKSKAIIQEADLLFILDMNALKRAESLGSRVEGSSAFKIMIDHHPDPSGFEDFSYHDTGSCSTAQLIYRFVNWLDPDFVPNPEIAEALYTGIITDSGNFKFSSVSPETHSVTARLLESGIDHELIHRKIYDSLSAKSIRIMGHALDQCLTLDLDNHSAWIAIKKEDIKQLRIESEDTEGLVNIPLKIKEVNFSVILKEYEGYTKMSFRSKDDFAVNKIASQYFNGGGHRNAAGGKLDQPLDKCIEILKEAIETYKHELLK